MNRRATSMSGELGLLLSKWDFSLVFMKLRARWQHHCAHVRSRCAELHDALTCADCVKPNSGIESDVHHRIPSPA